MKKFLKFIKIILRLIFGFLVFLFLFWLISYNWSFKEYISFLNNKNWSEQIKNINLTHPKSIFDIVLETENDVELTWNQEPLIENTVLTWNITTWGLLTWENTWNIDVYDPSFQDDFDEYFEWSNTELDTNYYGDSEEAWFKSQ